MKRVSIVLIIIILCFCVKAQGQSINVENNKEEIVYKVVDEHPYYPGGNEAIAEYFKNTLEYPEEAKKNKVEGMVFVQFVITKDGNIKDVFVKRGINKLLNQEAVRIIQEMDGWVPGKLDGEIVNVLFGLPVRFVL